MLPYRAPRFVFSQILIGTVLIASFIAPTASKADCSDGQQYKSGMDNAHADMLGRIFQLSNKVPKSNTQQEKNTNNEQSQINQGGGGDMFKKLWPMLSQLFNSTQGMSGTGAMQSQQSQAGICPTVSCTSTVTSATNQLATNGCLLNTASCLSQAQNLLGATAGTSCTAAAAAASATGSSCPATTTTTSSTTASPTTDPIYSLLDASSGQTCVIQSSSSNVNASCATQITALETSLFNANCGSNSSSGGSCSNSGGNGSGGGSGSGSGSGGSNSGGTPGFGVPSAQQIISPQSGGAPCQNQFQARKYW